MQEIKPDPVSPPDTLEPELRVGIVLPEDKRKGISFEVPSADFILSSAGNSLPLDAGKRYSIDNKDSSLRVSGEQVKNFLVSAEPILLSCKHELPLSPQNGVQFEAISTGRGFHWQKEIRQILPGKFEIHAHVDKLVLVNVLPFEDYLACVISSEMSAECHVEFMKAQAIAARSWAKVFLGNKHGGMPYSICNDDDCQRYQGTTHLSQSVIDAVKDCRGRFLIDQHGHVCPAYYSKSCGGFTEDPKLAFSFAVDGISPRFDSPLQEDSDQLDLRLEPIFTKWLDVKTLKGANIYCSKEVDLMRYLGAVDKKQSYFRWRHVLSGKDLCNHLQNKFHLVDLAYVCDIKLGARGRSGRILSITIYYETADGNKKEYILGDQYEIRRAFHSSFLFSSAFTLNIMHDDSGHINNLHFLGAGWGHGVGLCQIGALGMALSGSSAEQILSHYYPGCTIPPANENVR